MGAVIAAQLFAAVRRRQPDAVEALSQGNFAPLLTWLRSNVHGRGRLVSTDQLLIDATGSPLGPDAFKAHLKARYIDA
jgi:carboxypeptidase Taq